MTAFFLGVALIGTAGAAAWVLQGRPRVADAVFATLAVGGCATSLVPTVGVLLGRAAVSLSWDMGAPAGTWVFGIDVLSALFLVVVCGVGLANVLYGIAYLAPDRAHRSVGRAHFLTGLFWAAMALVVTAQATMPFLVAWEVMALSAYLLVVFEDEQPAARRAGVVYLAATHIGALALVAMFALWGSAAGGLTFAALGRASLPAGGAAVLSLALVGFGLKAGVVPLHFWLPGAHAAAPSHVSALMSGIMIKTGIYGVLRVISLVGWVPPWWGWTVLTLGAVSGVLGVLWALAQHDLKRLLAYHSIENVGIILLGVGTGALGIAYREPAVAVLGFAGAVLHTVNHALFKSLLFLAAGAVLRAAGSRAIDHLGGLARRMSWTWIGFLVGAVAITGLPPLNGLVSEWLVYQGLLRGGVAGRPLHVAVLGVAALALIGGLALACFVKVGGVVFLGEPRSAAAAQARERTVGYLLPMAALALACAAIGLLPAIALAPVLAVAGSIARASLETLEPVLGPLARAAWGLSLVSGGVVLLLTAGWVGRRVLARHRPPVWSETWGCGYPRPTPRVQYTAASFAAPLLQAFGRVAGVQTERTPTAFRTHPVDLVLEGVVLPAWREVWRAAETIRPVQHGRLHTYLLYIVGVLLVLLLYLWLGARA
ncbi:MAG TPA: proton-conducting transporter membrane subunit [Gemmatimonadales bacterium]|nr:proton-conducting transporter membrane subunit [Gemmatimonadales bacterium]